jgi:hypothetical protein
MIMVSLVADFSLENVQRKKEKSPALLPGRYSQV